MAKAGHVPAWLARRTYFKRIGRWAKFGRPRGSGSTPEATAPRASNVVPFPVRADRLEPAAFSDPRGVGIA